MMNRLVGVLLAFVSTLSIFYILFVPLPSLSIEFSTGSMGGERVVALGEMWETRYIHSLELTEVEDVYVFVDGKIWLWEERVKSHNAGLPTEPSRTGFFSIDEKWMRFFGGRFFSDRLVLRIGDNAIGRNQFRFPPGRWFDVFSYVPKSRCVVELKARSAMLYLMGI